MLPFIYSLKNLEVAMPDPNGIILRPIILRATGTEEALIRDQLKMLTPEMRRAPNCFTIWNDNNEKHFDENVGGHCHRLERPEDESGNHICILKNDLCARLIIHEVAHAWLYKAGAASICGEIAQILLGTVFTGVRPKPEEFANYPKGGLLTAWCTIDPEEVVAEMTAYASIFDPTNPKRSPFLRIDKKDLRFLKILKTMLREAFITPKVFVRVSKYISAS